MRFLLKIISQINTYKYCDEILIKNSTIKYLLKLPKYAKVILEITLKSNDNK